MCAWVIQVAALGLFLSFLVWLIAALLISLVLSQYIVHPGVKFLLSDHKLDVAVGTVTGLCAAASQLGDRTSHQLWSAVKGGWFGEVQRPHSSRLSPARESPGTRSVWSNQAGSTPSTPALRVHTTGALSFLELIMSRSNPEPHPDLYAEVTEQIIAALVAADYLLANTCLSQSEEVAAEHDCPQPPRSARPAGPGLA